MHSVALAHTVPLAALLATQLPLPLQVSGSVQALLVELPHAVPELAKFDWQVPLWQVSAPLQVVSVASPQGVPLLLLPPPPEHEPF